MPTDESEIDDQFETIHNHLDYVDRTLDSIADEIEEIIEDAIADAPVEVTHDIDDGTLQAQLPIEEVTTRISRRLDAPFFVTIEDSTLHIRDIRQEYDIEHYELEEIAAQKERVRSVKAVISDVESNHEEGAPLDKVIPLLGYLGVPPEEAKAEIQKLRQKGDVYEPRTDHLRTV